MTFKVTEPSINARTPSIKIFVISNFPKLPGGNHGGFQDEVQPIVLSSLIESVFQVECKVPVDIDLVPA